MRYILEVDAGVIARLEQWCREKALTFTSLMMEAWRTVLRRRLGSDDVVFGVTTSGRPASLGYMESIVGLFINTIPIRAPFDTSHSLEQRISQLQSLRSDTAQYEYLPLMEIYQCSKLTRGVPLFDSILVFDNYPVNTDLHQEDISYDHPLAEQNFNLAQTEFPLRVDIWRDRKTSIVFSYYSDSFPAPFIEQVAGELAEVMESFLKLI